MTFTKRGRISLFPLLVAAGLSACLTTTPPTSATPPIPIDLSPRCEPLFEGVDMRASTLAPRGPSVSVEALPRGARWFSVSAPTAPLDSLAWGFPAHGADARLAAALLEAGETSADPRGLRDWLIEIGGSVSAEVADDWLWLELRFPPAQRIAALRVFKRWLKIQAPSPEAFERIQRGLAIASLGEETSATKQVGRLFRRLHPIKGRARDFDAPKEEASATLVVDRLHLTLQPESSVALYVSSGGEDATRTVREQLVVWLASWPIVAAPPPLPRAQAKASVPVPVPAPAPAPAPEEPLPNESGTIHIIDRKGSPQVELLVGFPSVSADHPDTPALEMLASLLGSDVGGRLFRDLRERQGLAYIINAAQEPDGRFVVSTRARPERVGALVSGIEAHFRALTETPLLPCETRMLTDRMMGEATLAADDVSTLARGWRNDFARRGAPDPIPERVAAYLAAADQGFEDVARRIFSGQPTIVLVGDAKQLRRDLSRAFPGRPLRLYDGALRPTR